MATKRETTTLAPVSEIGTPGSRGARIKARRERMGWSARRLAVRAGIARDTYARVEADDPGVRIDTYAKAERALDELSAELGFDEAEQSGRLVRYEVHLPDATALIVSGPVEDRAELEESVARILAAMQQPGAGVNENGRSDTADGNGDGVGGQP